MKRRWFQVHLSTAIVLMLTAGLLLYANVNTRIVEMPLHGASDLYGVEVRGWPVWFWQFGENPGDGYEQFYSCRVSVNVTAILLILACAAAASESIIRRSTSDKS